MSKRTKPDDGPLDAAAALLVQHMRDFDPTYRMRIDGVMQERHLTPLMLCARMFSYVLRNSLQNEPVDDHLFETSGPTAPADALCEWCHKLLDAKWPGQKFHATPCTQQARDAGLLPPSKSRMKPVQPEPPPKEPGTFVDERGELSDEQILEQMEESGDL